MDAYRSPARSALGFVGGAVVLLLVAGAAQAASPNARIVKAKGTVEILGTPTGMWVAAASPAAVPPGSAVRTGPKSKAVIELDGAEVMLYETSLLRIPAVPAPASTASNPLRHPWLESGRALFDVTPRKDRLPFSVQTPTIVAGVKGTVFEVSSTGTEEAVYVWHGLVEVTSRLDGTDVQLVAGGQYTSLDDLRLTPALPIPDERTRPDEVDIHRSAVDTASLDRESSTNRTMEEFPAAPPLDSTLSLTADAWRDADRAAVKPALDQALDFQSVVSLGTVRISSDPLTDTLSSTTDTLTNTTQTAVDTSTSTTSSVVEPLTTTVSSATDPLTSTLTPVVDPLASTVTSVVDPLTSTLAPAVDPLISTVEPVIPLRTLGF
ncbi:MAG: FecR family protein [Nitrospirota bacterium]